MRKSWAVLAIVLMPFAAFGCSAIDEVAIPGTNQIGVGQCTNLEFGDETTEVNEIVTLDCAEEQKWEAFAETTVEGEEYPGMDAVTAQSEEFCLGEFETFIGASCDDSDFEMTFLHPTQESFDQGDSTISCLVGMDAGGLTGSLEGAGA